MHKMLSEREFRRRRIEDNLREIKKIDGEIAAHVRPNMVSASGHDHARLKSQIQLVY